MRVAAALQKAGASPGTAFGFLLAAPATNIPTLMVLSRGRVQVREAAKNALRSSPQQRGQAVACTAPHSLTGRTALRQAAARTATH